MRRIIVNNLDKEGNFFILEKEQLYHLKIAKRFKKLICVYEGVFFECKLEKNVAKIVKKLEFNNEFKNPVYLGISFIKIKNIELVIQKSVELGVKKIFVFSSENTEIKNLFNINKKIERFKKIIIGAAEQSARNFLTEIEFVGDIKNLLNIKKNISKFIAHEKEKTNSKLGLLPTNSLFLIGPEGGFTEKEVELAKENNFQVINLGKRVLKSETAAIYVLSRVDEN